MGILDDFLNKVTGDSNDENYQTQDQGLKKLIGGIVNVFQ